MTSETRQQAPEDLPATATAEQPFAALDPDAILDAVESTGLRTDGRLLALNSYENRVYQVGLDEADPVIVKFYRPARWTDAAIREEHTFTAELAAAGVPVVAPLLLDGDSLRHHAGLRLACFPRRGGRAPALDDPAVLGTLGRCLGRLHAIGRVTGFRHRERLDPQQWGRGSCAALLDNQWIPAHLETAFRTVCEHLLDACEARFAACSWQPLRLHGDCHVGNILWRDAQPLFVDLDDALAGPAIQDLWMLLSGSPDEMSGQLRRILDGYTQFADFNPAELALIEPLRSLRLLRHAAWLAARWSDPAFPLAFPWFDSNRYWEDLIGHLREQQAALDAPLLTLLPA